MVMLNFVRWLRSGLGDESDSWSIRELGEACRVGSTGSGQAPSVRASAAEQRSVLSLGYLTEDMHALQIYRI